MWDQTYVSLLGFGKKAKTLDIRVNFCDFSQHSFIPILSTWGVLVFFKWLQSSVDILFAIDENTPTKGLLSKLIQPELNNFTTLHSSADVMEPIETHAVPTGRNQASKNETEIAVADAPSQRRREECRLLSHNDTNCFCSIVEAINHFVNNHSTS